MDSVYDKVVTNKPICKVLWKVIATDYSIIFLSDRVRLSWNTGDKINLFLKLKRNMGVFLFVLTTPKTSPEKLTLTVVEMQQIPTNEKIDSKKISCLEWTKNDGRRKRKVCINFKTDTDNLNSVVYCYWNNFYLKDNVIDLKLTEYQSLLAKGVYLLSCIDILFKLCIVLDETTVHKYKKLHQEIMFF